MGKRVEVETGFVALWLFCIWWCVWGCYDQTYDIAASMRKIAAIAESHKP